MAKQAIREMDVNRYFIVNDFFFVNLCYVICIFDTNLITINFDFKSLAKSLMPDFLADMIFGKGEAKVEKPAEAKKAEAGGPHGHDEKPKVEAKPKKADNTFASLCWLTGGISSDNIGLSRSLARK